MTDPQPMSLETILDTLSRFEEWESILLDDEVPWAKKRRRLQDIHELTNTIKKSMSDLSERECAEIRAQALASDTLFLNRSMFAETPAIAFCQNYPPFILASALNAMKRLPTLSALHGDQLSWRVISADLQDAYLLDPRLDAALAQFTYSRIDYVGESRWFSESAQWHWGMVAFECVKDVPAEVIYSQAMWPGAHVAARHYKLRHPSVTWYAEFTDPMSTDANASPRRPAKVYEGDEAFLNTFWTDIETQTFIAADTLIFTNSNQMRFMLDHSCPPDMRAQVEAKSLVLGHPQVDPRCTRIDPFHYPLDPKSINVGYFGIFYPNRSPKELECVLQAPNVVLHTFSPEHDELDELAARHPGRVVRNRMLPFLQFLNTAQRMDYLFAIDLEYPGPVNPYLPSKIADYLTTSRPIIVDLKHGSPLSDTAPQRSLISVSEFLNKTRDFDPYTRSSPEAPSGDPNDPLE